MSDLELLCVAADSTSMACFEAPLLMGKTSLSPSHWKLPSLCPVVSRDKFVDVFGYVRRQDEFSGFTKKRKGI